MLTDEIISFWMKELITFFDILKFLPGSGVNECLADIKFRTAFIAISKRCFHNLQVDLSFEAFSKDGHSKILMIRFSGKLR